MKNNKILDSLYYTFTPGTKQIKFADQLGLKHKDILLIVNLSRNNQMIFNFGSATQGGSFANGVLTLVYDTTSMSATDNLMITVSSVDTNETLLSQILQEIKDQRVLNDLLLNLNTEDSILGAVITQAIKDSVVKPNEATNISTATTTLCTEGRGDLVRIVLNTPTNNDITIYDSITASGKILAVIDPAANTAPSFLEYGIRFKNGLTVVTAGTPDITIIYHQL